MGSGGAKFYNPAGADGRERKVVLQGWPRGPFESPQLLL